jgi:hypothetical protein
MAKNQDLWMQEAFGKHEGALKRQLHVPKRETIPVGLMREIEKTRVDEYGKKIVRNRGYSITVTRLLVLRVRPVLRAREARLMRKNP